MSEKKPFPFELGHAILLGEFKYVVRGVNETQVYLASITDVSGQSGKWLPKNRVPDPYTKIDDAIMQRYIKKFGTY